MAKFEIEEKEVLIPIKQEVYKLELDEKELKVLIAILWKVGGCPSNSFRKYIQPLIKSIDRQYGAYDSKWYKTINKSIDGSINFLEFNYKEPDICDTED